MSPQQEAEHLARCGRMAAWPPRGHTQRRMRLHAVARAACQMGAQWRLLHMLRCCDMAMASRLLMTGHAAATLASSAKSKPSTSGALTTAQAEK